MRIGQTNINISKLFSQGTVFSQPKTSHRNNSGINTIDDLRSGHFKNSYGVEGMGITGKSDWRKVINVSDEMKNHVLEDVKKRFINMEECQVAMLLNMTHIMIKYILM